MLQTNALAMTESLSLSGQKCDSKQHEDDQSRFHSLEEQIAMVTLVDLLQLER